MGSSSIQLLQQAQRLATTHQELTTGWKSRRFDRHGPRNEVGLRTNRTKALVLRGQVIEELSHNRYDEQAISQLTEALTVLEDVLT